MSAAMCRSRWAGRACLEGQNTHFPFRKVLLSLHSYITPCVDPLLLSRQPISAVLSTAALLQSQATAAEPYRTQSPSPRSMAIYLASLAAFAVYIIALSGLINLSTVR